MTPEQCQAARESLGWSRQDLAVRAQMASKTIRLFKEGKRQPFASTLSSLSAVFEAHGVNLAANNGEGPGAAEEGLKRTGLCLRYSSATGREPANGTAATGRGCPPP